MKNGLFQRLHVFLAVPRLQRLGASSGALPARRDTPGQKVKGKTVAKSSAGFGAWAEEALARASRGRSIQGRRFTVRA